MKEKEVIVTSKGQPDQKIKVKEAENLKELISLFGGENELLAAGNAQYKTNQMNKARKPASDPAAKALAAYLKNDKISQVEKDKVKAALKAAGVSL